MCLAQLLAAAKLKLKLKRGRWELRLVKLRLLLSTLHWKDGKLCWKRGGKKTQKQNNSTAPLWHISVPTDTRLSDDLLHGAQLSHEDPGLLSPTRT